MKVSGTRGRPCFNAAFPIAAPVSQQQLKFRNQRDFPTKEHNMTNLFLHAGAGEDAALFPQAGGDHLGHGGRVGCVFDLGRGGQI